MIKRDKKQVDDRYVKQLENELKISIQRNQILREEIKKNKYSRLQEKKGLIGKIARAPKTFKNIIRNPHALKEVFLKQCSRLQEKKSTPAIIENSKIKTSKEIKISHHPIGKIPSIRTPEKVKRLNVVIDNLDMGTLFGGVATALIIATEFVNQYDYELRIITRISEASSLDYRKIMKINNIEPARKISFYSDCMQYEKDNFYKMEIGDGDLFLATSWWSAEAISETISEEFFYVIQEVETFFYNYNDQHLACSKIMESDRIHFIINSSYLYEYFRQNNPNIVKNGVYFEPACSINKGQEIQFHKKNNEYKLFFYARPNHPRNLYAYGVHLLDLALQKKVIDPNEWRIYFAGSGSEDVQFSDGTKNVNLGQLTWEEYADFIKDVDLGFSLMYTPHPSYPPYDIACSGGVVLSNKMLNKTTFKECKNVLLSDLDEEKFMKAFKKAIELSKNFTQRKENYGQNRICRDWHKTLKKTITYMGQRSHVNE